MEMIVLNIKHVIIRPLIVNEHFVPENKWFVAGNDCSLQMSIN